MKKSLFLLLVMLAFVPTLSAQNNDVITLFGYLHVFPNDLGKFESEPKNIISNINENQTFGYCTWRIPTKEELSLLQSNNIVSSGITYMSKDGNDSGMVRLVTDEAKCSEIKVQNVAKAKQMKAQGVISGTFSVGSEKKVHFSKGNLQYQASTKTWRFANNQFDYIGESNKFISDSYDGWIDLYGWGATTKKDIHDSEYSRCYGWAVNVTNGSGRNWRSLNEYEYEYMLFKRETNSGIRFAKAQVNGVNGIMLLPDNWIKSTYSIINANVVDANCASNVISSDVWNDVFEANGAVFLPTAGKRIYSSSNTPYTPKEEYVDDYYYDGSGYYWVYPYREDAIYADYLYFNNWHVELKDTTTRRTGMSVRLVCPVDK